MYRISKRIEVAGAHWLDLDYDSPCKNLHGHNWIITVVLEGPDLNKNGMLLDFKHIKEVVQRLDHGDLNLVVQVNPTAENIAKWVAYEIENHLAHVDTPNFTTRVVKVSVQESEGNIAWYTP